MTVRAHLRISGRVQGVWFRASTQRHASNLGLVGWVKNTDAGEVEAEFQGPRPKVESMVEWCHRGPDMAQVDCVTVDWIDPREGEVTFWIRR
jgi:acylphosphatase